MNHRITQCRGEDAKKKIVAEYDLRPVSRLKLPPGHSEEGCCGELTDEQIVFAFTSKYRKSDEGTFSVGEDCAKQFLTLIGQPMPRLMDPFQGPPSLNRDHRDSEPGSGASARDQWATINIELYTAINLWYSLKKQTPKFALAKMLAEISSAPQTAIEEKRVFDFIKVVASYKSTLRELIDRARSQGMKPKDFSFPLLNEIAKKNWIDLP
jgi:hypothetical protein